MTLRIFQVDAFASKQFSGNPAAVIPLDSWLSDELMQNIALENNLSETAFFVPEANGFRIRWFTPTVEVDLCGHATLATAHVLFEHLGYTKNTITFQSRSGELSVSQSGDTYEMIFPSDELTVVETPPVFLEAIHPAPKATFKGRDDYLIVLNTQEEIENLSPDFKALATLTDCRGLITTAPGQTSDFVSRCFYPQSGVDEDPATGSAHTTLTPYWAKELNKQELTAIQLSARKGIFRCKYLQDKTTIVGKASTYLIGEIFIDKP